MSRAPTIAAPGPGRPAALTAASALALATLVAAGATGCGGGDDRETGLRARPAGRGPGIVWDLYRKPIAEIPQPNDVGTVFDERSPTGRRLNVSLDVPTDLERRIRGHMNELDGFGTFAPITLSFDSPLDLTTVTDETVLLVDIDPGSRTYGEAVPLDLGRGYFPTRDDPSQFFPFDPDGFRNGYLFGPGNEGDVDGDGVPEPLDHYEVETNTLIARPVYPLEQRSHYAVVITEGLRGRDGEPVRSPFPAVHHLDQTEGLREAAPLLEALGAPVDTWAFAWTFTTQSVTDLLEAARRGLDGEGPLARMASVAPPRLHGIENLDITTDGDGSLFFLGMPRDDQDNLYILQSEFFVPIIEAASSFSAPGEFPNLGVDGVDYFVFGSFLSPSLIQTPDRIMDVDPRTGEGTIGTDEVTFFLSIPRETAEHRPPFPVLIYAHGSNTARVEGIGLANTMSRFGYAVACIDAVGHGPFDPIADIKLDIEALTEDLPVPPSLIVGLLGLLTGVDFGGSGDLDAAVEKLFDVGVIEAIAEVGRAEDVDGDGTTDSGLAFFRANAFETRDTVRQTAIDIMQLIRVLKHLGEDAQFDLDGDGVPELDGDFDADGVVDLGGPDVDYVMSGTSLGGILTNVTMAVEPSLAAGAPIVPGGGIFDLLLRSRLRLVTQDMFLQLIGPVVVGCPVEGPVEGSGTVAVTMNNDAAETPGKSGCLPDFLAAATVAELPRRPGARVRLTNLANGETSERAVDGSGGFALPVAADVGDPLELTLIGADGGELSVRFDSLHEGLGFRRNTPDVRRFFGLAQFIFDPADPINYAPHHFLDPLPGVPPKRILQSSDPGDFTVPFNTHVALARVAGLMGDPETALAISDVLVAEDVMLPEGEVPREQLYDIDDLDRNNGGIGPLPPVPVGDGLSAVRFPMGAKHEYIGFSDPDAPIDWAVWSQNQIGLFLSSGGRTLVDDLCLADSSCPFLPPVPTP